MEQIVERGLLAGIAQDCADAEGIDALFARVLPGLRAQSGASGVLVIGRVNEGPVLHGADGATLPPVLVEAPAVPPEWAALGITRIRSWSLAGRQGDLVLAWNDAANRTEDDAATMAAVSTFVAAVARLDLARELADLTQRVDNAQMLASMGDYDWHIPTDTNRWSDQLYRIYGHEPQSFNASYERFLESIHPEDRERIQAVHQRAYATGEPYQMIERIVRPSGDVRYLSSNGEVIMDESSTPVRMRGTCIDITERVLAEQDRERVNQQFRTLVESAPEAILVFDARGTILLSNRQAVALLGGDPTTRLIADILPGTVQDGDAVEAVRLDGRELLLDVVRTELAGDAEHREVVFLRDAAPRLEREAMAQRLGEVQQRRRQALEINDNLVQGLTSALLALEFEDQPATRSYLDRTLGAARDMMDDLLDPHGQVLRPGDLVRSAATGLGPVATTIPDHGRVSDRVEPRRILIVDDAEDIRLLLRLKLNTVAAYEVVGEAADGQAAVEQARALQPNLVLLDMAMPRMDGLQALPLIRDAVPDVRVIVLSGFNQGTLEAEALAAGADRYVVKGAPMKDLMALIASVLDAA